MVPDIVRNAYPFKGMRLSRADAEAVLDLLIEISFIATFTQRFFGR